MRKMAREKALSYEDSAFLVDRDGPPTAACDQRDALWASPTNS